MLKESSKWQELSGQARKAANRCQSEETRVIGAEEARKKKHLVQRVDNAIYVVQNARKAFFIHEAKKNTF